MEFFDYNILIETSKKRTAQLDKWFVAKDYEALRNYYKSDINSSRSNSAVLARERASAFGERYTWLSLQNWECSKEDNTISRINSYLKGRYDKKGYGIIFSGTVGVGKDHLMASIYRCFQAFGYRNMRAGNFSEIYDKRFMDKIDQYDAFFLRDLGAENLDDYRRSFLFEIVDYAYNRDIPLFISTNMNNTQIKQHFGDRTLDRLREKCGVIAITGTSMRKKEAVI